MCWKLFFSFFFFWLSQNYGSPKEVNFHYLVLSLASSTAPINKLGNSILSYFISTSCIFYRLKFEKRLTNSVMPNVIGNVMDTLDFNGIYITKKTLKLVCVRCPCLQSLSLKGCGYLITDSVLQWLTKVRFSIHICKPSVCFYCCIFFRNMFTN